MNCYFNGNLVTKGSNDLSILFQYGHRLFRWLMCLMFFFLGNDFYLPVLTRGKDGHGQGFVD